ncbi:hypothetical protein AYO21_05335 [Fonsecaea monophora]|uniref:Protein kinase domain-containing protein n=1 Tax=Fonsecaea monophora TaxID=254056 RepID=A0A177F8C3_9EURO|nr:hypothetical protein AYO21_05335 [Fonsecaea monophora]OAG40435.1 hypothetical protein AYO21_05335 [Fonsecaea monophora]
MQNPDYTIDRMTKLDDDNILIRSRFRGRVFDIEFGPNDLHDPASPIGSQPFEQQYLDALQHSFGDDESAEASEADEDDAATDFSDCSGRFDTAASPMSSECGCEEDPVIAFAVGPFLTHRTFETFAPESSTPCLNTLQDVLHPPLLSFTLRVVGGDLVPISRSPEKLETADPPWATVWKSEHWLEYPHVEAKDITLAQTSQTSSNTNLVMFNNRICWFKPVLDYVDSPPYIREIDILSKLSRENLSHRLRCPQIEAIVLDDKDGNRGFINGLILSAIYPNNGTIADRVNGPEGLSLPMALCERWYRDIEDMVHLLHEKDFVWGDVSPNNMVIDANENVCMIDFGGGYTEGWVDEEDRETKKGDLEGLKRIKEYLLDMDRTGDATE